MLGEGKVLHEAEVRVQVLDVHVDADVQPNREEVVCADIRGVAGRNLLHHLHRLEQHQQHVYRVREERQRVQMLDCCSERLLLSRLVVLVEDGVKLLGRELAEPADPLVEGSVVLEVFFAAAEEAVEEDGVDSPDDEHAELENLLPGHTVSDGGLFDELLDEGDHFMRRHFLNGRGGNGLVEAEDLHAVAVALVEEEAVESLLDVVVQFATIRHHVRSALAEKARHHRCPLLNG
mmetsp:Transcript_3916/g.13876  ORF Transcript_3916/g.13876 Transcript_3916/m.13876 type:complete len:234 (-) Transcript_3916:1820-2521(-)